MIHLDMFSGIGLFSYAADHVWNLEHIFCEIEDWPYRFLKQEYPNARIERDVKTFDGTEYTGGTFLLTAGVPCQPASVAGKRQGTEDDRWLWPEVLRVMAEAQPEWCIFENPLGILTLEKGLVFENLLLEMESQGYAVQPYIIPACAIGAVHERYRVWIVAHSKRSYDRGKPREFQKQNEQQKKKRPKKRLAESRGTNKRTSSDSEFKYGRKDTKRRLDLEQNPLAETRWNKNPDTPYTHNSDVADTAKIRLQGSIKTNGSEGQKSGNKFVNGRHREWQTPWGWPEVAIKSCIRGVDVSFTNGIYEVEKFEKGERIKRMKALGNTIQWEVAVEIMQAIKSCEFQEAIF